MFYMYRSSCIVFWAANAPGIDQGIYRQKWVLSHFLPTGSTSQLLYYDDKTVFYKS